MLKGTFKVMAKRVRRVLSEAEKKSRIERWATKSGLDGADIAGKLIEKYGVDKAYQLASDSMMKPFEVAKKEKFSPRSSAKTLQYLANEAAAPEQPVEKAVQKEEVKKEDVKREEAKPVQPSTAEVSKRDDAPSVEAVAPKSNVTIKNDKVAESHQLRTAYMDNKFPELKESDFSSHEEYMSSLRKQYAEMRSYEWEMVCQQETLDMYNISKNPNVNPNRATWSGKFDDNTNYCASDSTYVTQGHIPGVSIRGSAASCAGTATRVSDAICSRFGYSGSERFYQDYAHCAGAVSIHDNPATKQYKHTNKSMKAMIEAGQIGPGTIVSVPSRNTGSGYHALTVAQVIKDENGKITDVVLQANNKTTLKKYPVKTIDNDLRRVYSRGSSRPFIATSTHVWADEKIAEETRRIPDDQLEAAIAKERGRLNDSATRLAEIEEKSCRLNMDYERTVLAQNDELRQGLSPNMEIAQNIAPVEFRYTEAERQSLRNSLLGLDNTSSSDRVNLVEQLQADAKNMQDQLSNGTPYYKNDGQTAEQEAKLSRKVDERSEQKPVRTVHINDLIRYTQNNQRNS